MNARLCNTATVALALLGAAPMVAAAGPLADSRDCVVGPHAVVDVSSAVPGLLEAVNVERSDAVRAGQVLARLESGVERASLDLAQAWSSIDSEVRIEEISRALDRRRNDRIARLYASRAVALDDKDQAETEAALAALRLRQAEEKRWIRELDARKAAAALERRTVRSPIDGVVVERFRAAGEYVENQPIVRIAQLDPLQVETILPMDLFGQVTPGMVAEVRAEHAPEMTHRAVVSLVDRVGDAASGTFGVRLSLPNPGRGIPAGLKCTLRFLPGEREAVPEREVPAAVTPPPPAAAEPAPDPAVPPSPVPVPEPTAPALEATAPVGAAQPIAADTGGMHSAPAAPGEPVLPDSARARAPDAVGVDSVPVALADPVSAGEAQARAPGAVGQDTAPTAPADPAPQAMAAPRAGDTSGSAPASPGGPGTAPTTLAGAGPRPADAPATQLSTVAATAPRCAAIGPLDDAGQAERLARALEDNGAGARVEREAIVETAGFIVLTPPAGDLDAAKRLAATIAAAGIRDMVVLRRGDYANRVSLGVFAKESTAERRRDDLAALGFTTTVLERTRSRDGWVVHVRLPAGVEAGRLLPAAAAELVAGPHACDAHRAAGTTAADAAS